MIRRSATVAMLLALAGAYGCGRGESQGTPHDQMTPDEMARMTEPAPAAPHAPAVSGDIDLAPGRLQAIGVRFGPAVRRSLDRRIHAAGRVAVDERRLSRVNVKVEGWIERLYVNTTGEEVRSGQPLLTLYSPDVVASQEEYLLALQGARTLGRSASPEVAEGARAVLDAARRRLELWDIADGDLRDLERSGRVVKALPIHAPLGGTVLEKMAVAGMRVMPGEDLYLIADLARVWVLADVYESELPYVAVGQVASITPLHDPATALTGGVSFIYPTVEPETRTARVRFELDNPRRQLKPDMYVNVDLDVPLGNRLVLPKDAILESGERRIVFVRREGGFLTWRQVRTGARAGDWVEVLEGVSEGEEVVTSANFLLDSESQVRGAMAGMAGMDMTGGSDASKARPAE